LVDLRALTWAVLLTVPFYFWEIVWQFSAIWDELEQVLKIMSVEDVFASSTGRYAGAVMLQSVLIHLTTAAGFVTAVTSAILLAQWRAPNLSWRLYWRTASAMSVFLFVLYTSNEALYYAETSLTEDPSLYRQDSNWVYTALYVTSAVTATMIAAYLYSRLKSPNPDPVDRRRLLALLIAGIAASAIPIAGSVDVAWQRFTIAGDKDIDRSVPYQIFVTTIGSIEWLYARFGLVFGFGAPAILVLKRLGNDASLPAVVVAATVAAMGAWSVSQGPALLAGMVSGTMSTDWHWQQDARIQQLIWYLSLSLAAGLFYWVYVDRDRFDRARKIRPKILVASIRDWRPFPRGMGKGD
jgi:hypothetical protein